MNLFDCRVHLTLIVVITNIIAMSPGRVGLCPPRLLSQMLMLLITHVLTPWYPLLKSVPSLVWEWAGEMSSKIGLMKMYIFVTS